MYLSRNIQVVRSAYWVSRDEPASWNPKVQIHKVDRVKTECRARTMICDRKPGFKLRCNDWRWRGVELQQPSFGRVSASNFSNKEGRGLISELPY